MLQIGHKINIPVFRLPMNESHAFIVSASRRHAFAFQIRSRDLPKRFQKRIERCDTPVQRVFPSQDLFQAEGLSGAVYVHPVILRPQGQPEKSRADLPHLFIIFLVILEPRGNLRNTLQCDDGTSAKDIVLYLTEGFHRDELNTGKKQHPIRHLPQVQCAFIQVCPLYYVIINQVKGIPVNGKQLPQVAKIKFPGPFSGVQHVLGPLVGQGRIHGHVRDEPPVTQQGAASRGISGQVMIIRPPDVFMTDANRGKETARRDDIPFRRGNITMVIKLVGPGAQKPVRGNLQFFQGRPVRFPMQVGKCLRADDSPSVQVRA
ncbi:MAG: hypothetical protein BWX80_00190 [Candidatus Hydrogenedentes bacterium ADurb.Bin101]|nr:MAG: hypothetical protein BWX80_00190 [Candidatus Hydrogenedentes bacterium ADurb.Bin101]